MCLADEFNIYTREAGAGVLSVAIEGPSKAKIEINENPNGYSMVSYTVTKEGLNTDFLSFCLYFYLFIFNIFSSS